MTILAFNCGSSTLKPKCVEIDDHQFMVDHHVAITSALSKGVKLITLQLGNGCSAFAVKGGRSIDTSMGFKHLEGLMMGTRSGNIDFHLTAFFARAEGVDVENVEEWLNAKSGFFGRIGSFTGYACTVKGREGRASDAAFAVKTFCCRVRKEVGAYLAVLGGADAVVFGEGIGENGPEVRRRICAGMEWCGLVMDEEKNSAAVGTEARITIEHSKVQACVIPVDEEVIIARDTLQCIKKEVA